MPEAHPFEEMLKKISEAMRAELGPAYPTLVEGTDMALAIAAKVTLAVANVASGKMLDRSNQRAIKDFQESCMQRVYMAAVAESFQNKALLSKIQTAMIQAIEAAQKISKEPK